MQDAAQGPSTRSRIAMVAYGDISHDSRVQREADSLARAGYAVTLFCLAAAPELEGQLHPGVTIVVRPADTTAVIPGSPRPFGRRGPRIRGMVDRVLWLIRYARNLLAWGSDIAHAGPGHDVWHVHDFTGLLAVHRAIGKDAVVVYDVHDVFVDTGVALRLPGLVRRAIARYEGRLARRARLVIAVNQGVADVVRRRYRLAPPVVVHNCPPRWNVPEPLPDLIRTAVGLPAATQVVLYHGLLASDRGIETLCQAILEPDLEAVHLALLGYGEMEARLREIASETRFSGRIHLLPPVSPTALLPWVASADVGALAMPHSSLNLYLSTPNKLFECLAVGTPVVVSDFPTIRRIVLDDPAGPLGVTCDPAAPADVARAIRALITMDPVARSDLRRRCAEAAALRWNWEHEVGGLIQAYERFAGRPG
jgi:glycosyltransferase involved in cell wall biosynthesis